MDLTCGNSIISKQLLRCELLQGRKDRIFANIWDRWENHLQYRKSQKDIVWNDEFVRNLDHIVQIDITHEAPAEQRGRYSNLVNLHGKEETNQGMPLAKRPGYHEAILAITEVQRQVRREMNIVHIPTKNRRRLNGTLDPKIREYLECLSEN